MRILQMHADWIEYEPVRKEISGAEEVEKKKYRLEEILVLFVSVEEGDGPKVGIEAVDEVEKFLKNVKVNKILIYPFAHLSRSLAKPDEALKIIKEMEAHAKKLKIEVYRAPFGWNKALAIKVKAHPLAEQSKVFGSSKEKKVEMKSVREIKNPMVLIKRSDFEGLSEKDHRIIGEQLDLFSFQEVGPGMVFLHPKGVILRNILIDFWRKEHSKRGYQEISAPILLNNALWQVSGHWDHFRENMFFSEVENQGFGLKPMNCPNAMLVFKNKSRSYRDLPIRYNELGLVHRNELSGVLSGLFRLRAFVQDDAHIFVDEKNLEKEIIAVIDLVKYFYDVFGFEYSVELSLKPEKAMGDERIWKKAEEALEKSLKDAKIKYSKNPGEGAFYGPKIDFHIKDSMDRKWQLATVQLDSVMPERFKASYIGEDGKEHIPIVIHRVIYGALERFMGILVEHYQGKFPVWLAPVQVRILPISDDNNKHAQKLLNELLENDIRAEGDFDSHKIEYKIKMAQLQKIPYMIIIGKKEEDSKSIAVRDREGKVKFKVKLEDFVKELKKQIEKRN
ncbi:MAG: threonine--tRNA ligase [Candidatus Aenigmarchaeota archaeon]|nr:threonine--tRNA ligase [Candidatus Aenigmarchaeota archaeon]